MRLLKAVGGERSHNVLDALAGRLERNGGTFDNQRRVLRVTPECTDERMDVNHRVLSNKAARSREAATRALHRFNLVAVATGESCLRLHFTL
jgi:hypothetical protein